MLAPAGSGLMQHRLTERDALEHGNPVVHEAGMQGVFGCDILKSEQSSLNTIRLQLIDIDRRMLTETRSPLPTDRQKSSDSKASRQSEPIKRLTWRQ